MSLKAKNQESTPSHITRSTYIKIIITVHIIILSISILIID
jgi:hypothetical protein